MLANRCAAFQSARWFFRPEDHRIHMAVIVEVATAAGFNGSNYLIRFFRRELGLSPMAYRDRLQQSRGVVSE
jgi:AraC-like DNA-binding protein